MKTRKNVKGFTLVELIVVIAIIGVLAAILVPSMLGYVKKANVSAANSNAKTLYNAVVTTLTDLDSAGTPITDSGDVTLGGTAKTGSNDASDAFSNQLALTFTDMNKLSDAHAYIENGLCNTVYVKKGNYYGGYPSQSTEKNASSAPSYDATAKEYKFC